MKGSKKQKKQKKAIDQTTPKKMTVLLKRANSNVVIVRKYFQMKTHSMFTRKTAITCDSFVQ